MFSYLDTTSLLALGLAVCTASFFIASLMDGVLEGDGFGTTGNMVILVAGAFLGFYVGNLITPYGANAVYTAVAGVSGAFGSLAILAIMKALLSRFGY